MSAKLEFLKNVFLFKDIEERFIAELLQFMEFKKYSAGSDIIKEGEKGSSLFFLFKGEVTVTKRMTLFAEISGINHVDKSFIRLKDGDYAFFGEMALCGEDEIRSATVTADTDCELGIVQAGRLQEMIYKNPDFGGLFYRNLAYVLANRLRKANKDILKLTTALTLALEGS